MKGENMEKIVYSDEFEKIITFFLFECPVEKVSHRGEDFQELGWKGSSRLQMLERLLKGCTEIAEEKWICCHKSEVESKANNIGSFLYIVCNNDKGRIKSIIYAIRNSFAHGSFEVKKIDGCNCYYLENWYKEKLRAKIVIEEKALLDWVKIIKTNPIYLTKKAIKKNAKERKRSKQTNYSDK